MTGRERSLILLLNSLEDYLPALHGSLNTTTGMAAQARKPCPDCGHQEIVGWIVDAFKRRRPCVSCGGSQEPSGAHGQWVARDRGRGWVHFDPMDTLQRPVQTSQASAPPTRPARVVRCDACDGTGTGKPHLDENGREYRDRCAYCDGSGQRTIASFDLQLEHASSERTDPVTEAIERRAEVGSYCELDHALARLPGPWRAVVWNVHVAQVAEREQLEPRQQVVLDVAVRSLLLAMPDRIRVPGAVREAEKRRQAHRAVVKGRRGLATAARDKEIRKLLRQGRPVPWVAREYGLSVRRVYQIRDGQAEAA